MRCDFNPFPKFQRNPKLKLILRERDSAAYNGGPSVFAPVYSRDGTGIFYLRGPEAYEYSGQGGNLWRINSNGTGKVELLEDTFFGLAVSPNGNQLALTCGDASGGRIVLYSLQTGEVDTLHTGVEDIFDVEFSRARDVLFYSSKTCGIYAVNTDGTNPRHLDTTCAYFDLTSNDSVVVGVCWGSKPAVHPSDAFYAADSGHQSWRHGIFLVDMATGDTTRLDAMPYRRTGTGRKCWSPDGRQLVFTAMEWQGGDPLRPTGSEIWLLDSVTAK